MQPDAAKNYPKLTVPPTQVDAKNAERRHFFRLEGVTEKAHPEWNRVQVNAAGDTLEVRVNGVLANRATGLSLRKGRIGLQAEGVPVEFRRAEVVGVK